MFKNIWQKLKQRHSLLMAICCLAPIILAVGFLSLYKSGGDYWLWLIILFCPLLHIFMMREGHKHDISKNEAASEFKCPECGLTYKEKNWRDKCTQWCAEHKSCNLEIIKHATDK